MVCEDPKVVMSSSDLSVLILVLMEYGLRGNEVTLTPHTVAKS